MSEFIAFSKVPVGGLFLTLHSQQISLLGDRIKGDRKMAYLAADIADMRREQFPIFFSILFAKQRQ